MTSEQYHQKLHPDDQKFIDLALAVNARWLFSKDRALLALARPARAYDVQVLTPAQWQRQCMASSAAPACAAPPG